MAQIRDTVAAPVVAPELTYTNLPRFFQELGVLAAATDDPAFATNAAFEDANIRLRVEGDDLTDAAQNGLLLASDHRMGREVLLALGSMNQIGRTDTHIIAKAFIPTVHMLGKAGVGNLILPVIPGTMAAEKKGRATINEDLFHRLTHPSAIRPKQELQAMNQSILERAATIISNNGSVVICPTGYVSDAAVAPWQRGVGSIVRMLPEEAKETAHVALFRADTFSQLRFLAAIAVRQIGLRLPAQTITLRTADIGRPAELFAEELSIADPKIADVAITEKIRQQYLQRFAAYQQ